ncbi:MAG: hypothetical protein HYU43_00850 [Armatimonadetes bacterium]|nr:hypothetical protein [Armatimonadota bacterium]
MARVVIRRRLETPAIFFLEMHKPLTALASAALAFSQPTLGVFFGFRRLAEWAALLDDRENLDRLIVRIERLSADAGYSAGQGEPESCMNRGGKGTQSLSE